MKDTFMIILAIALVALALLFANNYSALIYARRNNRRLAMINEFLFSLTSLGGPSLNLLTKMEVEILKSLEPQLIEYYRRKFFKLITKSAIEEIEPYIKSVNELPDSPQKEFIKKTLKKEIFSGKAVNLADIIFRLVKLNNIEDSKNGLILRKFLFDDMNYLSDKRKYLTAVFMQCLHSLEKISVDEKIKPLMINDFNELIRKINKQ